MQFNFIVYFFGVSWIMSYREQVKANESDIKESPKRRQIVHWYQILPQSIVTHSSGFRGVAFAKWSSPASRFKHVKRASELPLLWQNLGATLHSRAQGHQTPFVNAAKGLLRATVISPHVNVMLDLVKSLEVKSDHSTLNPVHLFVCWNDGLSLTARMYGMCRRTFQQIYQLPLPEVEGVRPPFILLEKRCTMSFVPNIYVVFLPLQMQIWSQYYWNKDLRRYLQWCETLRCKCITHTRQSSFYRPTAGESSDSEAVNHLRHHHDDPQANPTLRHFLPFKDSRLRW